MFFTLASGWRRTALHVSPDLKDIEPEDLLLGKEVPANPIFCDYHSCSRPMDLIATTWAILFLFSEKVIKTLQGIGATGWSTFPVKVIGKNRKPVSGYYGLSVTGRSGPISLSDEDIVTLPPPVEGGRESQWYKGFHFDIETWDQSDFFIPEETNIIMVTEKVALALKDATNFEIADYRLYETKVLRRKS